MQVRMTQHAVGQGGLFVGSINADAGPFRWAYDCGSNQMDALRREILEVSHEGDIDMLFLSHLDSDHVNGIDLLLTQCKVVEVVIPYLEDEVYLALLAKDAARGALTTSFIELVSDMPGWFANRGVNQITQVRGETDEGEGGTSPEPPRGEGGAGTIRPKWSPEAEAAPSVFRDRQPMVLLREVVSRATVALTTSSGFLNWAFIPYVHLPPARLISAFRDALEREFGTPLNREAISSAAKYPKGREQLRRCYDALWLNHNLVSMTLYAGPVSRHTGEISLPHQWMHSSSRQGGWLLTGDADFEGQQRRQKFMAHYSSVASMVNVLMTPHHGSIHNFSPLALHSFENLIIGYAAAGPNPYGHPHTEVRHAVDFHPGARFLRVGHMRQTRLELRVILR